MEQEYDYEYEELEEDYDYDPEDCIEFEIDDSLVILEGPERECTVCGIKLYFREGVWCEKDDDGEFMPDWDLTWFYINKDDLQDYVYFEQDPPGTALHNLSYALKSNPDSLETLKRRVRATRESDDESEH